MPAVVTEGLTKRFGDTEALKGVDLEIERATILGVLGPNGAGKTTTVRILTTLLRPDSGRAFIDGIDVVADPRRARARIGLTGQYAAVDERLSGFENLQLVGRLFHLPTSDARRRAHELLERFGLADAGDRVVKGYSGGMRRRLDIAMSLIAEPSVLFLDEPTTGLDPRSRLEMWDVIDGLVADGWYSFFTNAEGVVIASSDPGLIEPGNFTAYLFPISVAAETILFSFALAYRIQMLKQEKAEALQQADREKTARLAQVQASADELQAAVAARTAELAAANARLCLRERELEHAAFHDPLTELPNRRYLVERCESALAHAERHGESVALLLIDLDHFKPINDRFGHAAGDLMLQVIAKRLREHVRAGDAVARLGGDEFAVLICGQDAENQARDIAGRLLADLSEPVHYGAERLRVTISIGVALYPLHARHFAGLYKAADQALYRAKELGRSGSQVHGEGGELSEQACLQLDVLMIPSGLA